MAKTLFADTESQASGTPLSTSNSLFNAFLGTPTFDNAHAMHGSNSLKFGGTSGAASYGAKTGISATAFNMWGYEYFTSAPTTDTYLGRFLVGSTRILSLHINAAGKLRVSDNTGTTGVTGWSGSGGTSAAAAIPINQQWRWELYGKIGAAASTGDILFAYFLGDSTTPIETLTISGAANLGTAAITVLNLGKSDTGAYASPFWTDDAGYDLAAAGLPGPYIAGTPGSVSTIAAIATAAAAAPTISGDTLITGGGPAAATATAPAPSLSAGATVTSAKGSATALAPVPSISAAASVTGPSATGAAAAGAPAIAAGAQVAMPSATATGFAPIPAVSGSGSATVSAVTATATATARVPSLSIGSTVPAERATATATAPVPSISAGGSATVTAVAATGSAASRVPSLSIGSVVTATAAAAVARAHAPTFGGNSRDITVTISGPHRNQLRASVPLRNPLTVSGGYR